MVFTVEWIPQEENSMSDELSKLVIPDDWMLRTSLSGSYNIGGGGIR